MGKPTFKVGDVVVLKPGKAYVGTNTDGIKVGVPFVVGSVIESTDCINCVGGEGGHAATRFEYAKLPEPEPVHEPETLADRVAQVSAVKVALKALNDNLVVAIRINADRITKNNQDCQTNRVINKSDFKTDFDGDPLQNKGSLNRYPQSIDIVYLDENDTRCDRVVVEDGLGNRYYCNFLTIADKVKLLDELTHQGDE